MKYTSLINNAKTLEWGITISQAFLVDLITMSAMWAERETIDGLDYYWMSRNKVLDELPHVFKEADTVYRALKGLHKKGIIDYRKAGKRDVVRLTQKGLEWSFRQDASNQQLGNRSELNTKLGNRSEKTRNEIRENSERDPTDNITNNNITRDKGAAETSNPCDQEKTDSNQQGSENITQAISEQEAFTVLKMAGVFPMLVNQPNLKHFKPEIFKFNSWFEDSNFKTNQLRAKLTAWFQRIDPKDREKFYTDDQVLDQQISHPSHRISEPSTTPKMSVEEQRAAMQKVMAQFKGGSK